MTFPKKPDGNFSVISDRKKNYHFDLTGAFSNIIEESEAIEYDDDDDEDEFDDDDDD